MSVIYDALKKIEKRLNVKGTEVKTDKDSKSKFKVYLIYSLLIFSSFFIASIFFRVLTAPQVSTIPFKKPVESNIKAAVETTAPEVEEDAKEVERPAEKIKPPPRISLVLNGVFYSEDEAYALINNQIVKEGDVVEGAKVRKIFAEEVELESDGSIIKLSTRK